MSDMTRSVACCRHEPPRPPGRISDCKSEVRTTETMLVHVVYRQSHHNCKTLAPLLSSLTSSTPQQHGKSRICSFQAPMLYKTNRIATTYARLPVRAPQHMLLCIFKTRDYQYERARCYLSYLCLA
jgi:hypothetical protein